MAGGRELWAIPKGLCDFTLESEHRGPLTADRVVGAHRAADRSRARTFTRRLPRRAAAAVQGRHLAARASEDTGGEERTATLQGSSKAAALPRARWDFDPDGPLGWLRGARQLASFRQAAFRMSFG